MKKYMIFGLVVFLILIGTLSVIAVQPKNQITHLKYTNSSTKAICTEDNFCQDYQIFCMNDEFVSMAPITGAAVQFSEDWEDPRSNTEKDLC